MDILHVIASLAPESGGPAKACLEMARATARRGHRVAIFTTDRGMRRAPPARETGSDGVAISCFPTEAPRLIGTSWPLARALAKSVGGFGLVHLHSLHLFHDWATARACRAKGVPYILRPHGSLDPYQHRQHRWRKAILELLFQDRVTAGAALIHYTSEDEMRRSAPNARGVPGAVVPLGLDPADYAALPARGGFRARHPEIGARPVVLFMGRLHAKKGLDLLAQAFAGCAEALDAHLVVAGPDDGMAAPVRRILDAAGLGGRVTFTGMVEGGDKLALLADADLFVLASHHENFGLAVVEALACGVPVLISEEINLWREVAAAECGLVVPLSPPGIAEAIAALLRDPARRRAMGERGRALVAGRFAWDKVAAQLEEVYRRAAARG